MNKITITIIIIITLLNSVYAQNMTFIEEDEWLSATKELYKDYIDSGMFFVVAMVIFVPIILGGLAGLGIGRKGQVSIFMLEMILGVLMFLLFPYLKGYLLTLVVV